MKKTFLLSLLFVIIPFCLVFPDKIDRKALVSRNNPHICRFDTLASLSVGNGEFAFTVDATGLQSFPQMYKNGVPLGTESQWGWHSFPNIHGYKHSETLKDYNFRGREEPYSVQFKTPKRKRDASNYFRVNPHRLHLGQIGFDFSAKQDLKRISDIKQYLDLWTGTIHSKFSLSGIPVNVETTCDSLRDGICVHISSKKIPAIRFTFAYPTGGHSDDGCNWNVPNKHQTIQIYSSKNQAILKRILDTTVYYVQISWKGKAKFVMKKKHEFLLIPQTNNFTFASEFLAKEPNKNQPLINEPVFAHAKEYWYNYWTKGAAVDFSACTDPRAKELERRVVLSQYLLAIQCAGTTPPQETGLTYNSWYGKFHLEMIWWHEAQFALWNRPQLLERTLNWYFKVLPVAKEIAKRQGFDGARWMKMTDPSGMEAPSGVGSFLIWQQPHIIYLAELVYRDHPNKAFLKKYANLIDQTARFMYSFADYDSTKNRYILKGIIPAQETLKASKTINPPFELSYWHFALGIAQKWRERLGEKRNPKWDIMIHKLSHLASKDSLYLAAESEPDTYHNIKYTSDHMAVLGAYGVLPYCDLFKKDIMQNTLNWVWKNWNWNKTWGWDYPMVAMDAARLGDTQKAVGALLMKKQTNTYLINGHNYQDSRLRVYLPGNGGLLTAVAMMCAGWDGCKIKNPGFPKNGKWDVKWEGLHPLP